MKKFLDLISDCLGEVAEIMPWDLEEWDYEETIPELVKAREREIVVVCRSGYRSVLSAFSMKMLGYPNVVSLKTGLRGWNDFEQPLVDQDDNPVDIDDADDYFTPNLREDQLSPK
jgi:3-mercaptopyruvate sulfurtransferase SseA